MCFSAIKDMYSRAQCYTHTLFFFFVQSLGQKYLRLFHKKLVRIFEEKARKKKLYIPAEASTTDRKFGARKRCGKLNLEAPTGISWERKKKKGIEGVNFMAQTQLLLLLIPSLTASFFISLFVSFQGALRFSKKNWVSLIECNKNDDKWFILMADSHRSFRRCTNTMYFTFIFDTIRVG